ncbi:MAG: O-acetyl-ADP-ribose deacetylase [Candidatus Marinimicrobia bacterium]|nr:O-acetyl-ADP-ribose deacetylase [Candidatus Neomarinimicrobiota bacterium]
MNLLDRIVILEADITKEKVNAIVNAANRSLLGGGGVDGAIHRATGRRLLEECREIRKKEYPDGLPAGQAVITKGYNLLVKYVIHTVGPVWRNGSYNEPKLLADCYRNCLRLAAEHEIKSISFPAISTGAYMYPKELAAKTAILETLKYLEKHELPEVVHFVVIGENVAIYKRIFKSLK